TAVTGSPTVNGTIHAGDSAAATAQADLTTAYNDAAGRTVGGVTVAGDLGGLTLTPGLYKSTSTLAITGDLTLAPQGDANGVLILQLASGLTTAGRHILASVSLAHARTRSHVALTQSNGARTRSTPQPSCDTSSPAKALSTTKAKSSQTHERISSGSKKGSTSCHAPLPSYYCAQ